MRTALSILFLCAASVFAQPYQRTNWTALCEWDKSTDATVTGYLLYAATNSFWQGTNQIINQTTIARVDAGTNLTATVSNLPLNTTMFFVVTCYNADRIESDYSNEVSKKVSKPPATRIRINVMLQVSATPDGPWGDLGLVGCYDADTTGEDEFYRGVLLVEKTTTQ